MPRANGFYPIRNYAFRHSRVISIDFCFPNSTLFDLQQTMEVDPSCGFLTIAQ